jgi:hypothetical protein
MLVSFSIENFHSFREEQTLNLLASRRLGGAEKSPHCRELPSTNEHVLRLASLYGANGAGKSNVVRALEHVKRMVESGTPVGRAIPYEPFALDEETLLKPTCIDLQFVEHGDVFRYGIAHDAQRIAEEWLSVYEGTKERVLFTRTTTESGQVAVELGDAAIGPDGSRKLKALAEVGARANQLFLTELINLNDPQVQGPRFERTIRWFSRLSVVNPNQGMPPALVTDLMENEGLSQFAGKLLRESGTGITRIDVATHEIDMPANTGDNPDQLNKFLGYLDATSAQTIGLPDGHEYFLDFTTPGKAQVRMLTAVHHSGYGRAIGLPIGHESDGSRRLLRLLPILYQFEKTGGVFVVDELERSMHPMLARKIIEYFVKGEHGSPSQLIFTTHESTLLDLDLMRRDEIWFTEKDPAGATHLYSLADFKVRKDLRIEKGYLDGRFGAIPFLGGIDRIIEEQAAPEAAT